MGPINVANLIFVGISSVNVCPRGTSHHGVPKCSYFQSPIQPYTQKLWTQARDESRWHDYTY
eukprot:3762598-Amphidinium_carterae.1